MRILVYGAGVLGCNLARAFCKAGKDVTLLARGAWADTIRKNGLCIQNWLMPIKSTSRIRVVTELAPNDAYDVIFVALRYTQLPTILDTLTANQSKNLVFLGNNMQPDALAVRLPEKNVMFAFASSAGHREKDRVVSVDLKKITIGQLRDAQSNEALIQEIFARTGYKVSYEPNMGDYLCSHAAFVIPAVFACYHTDGNLKRLKGNTAYFNRMVDAVQEGYRALVKTGHEILPREDADFEGQAFRRTCLKFFGLMCATSLGKICASDHAMNAAEEMSALNTELKKLFEAAGTEYPAWKELEKGAGKYLKATE